MANLIELCFKLQEETQRLRDALNDMSMVAFKIRDSRSDHQDWNEHVEYAQGFEDACESIHESLTKIYNDCIFPETTQAIEPME